MPDDAVVDITGSLADTTHLADSVVKTTTTVEFVFLAEDPLNLDRWGLESGLVLDN